MSFRTNYPEIKSIYRAFNITISEPRTVFLVSMLVTNLNDQIAQIWLRKGLCQHWHYLDAYKFAQNPRCASPIRTSPFSPFEV